MAYAVQGVARLIQPIFWHVAKPKDLIGQVANIALLGYVAFKALGILAKKYHFTPLNTAEDKLRLAEEKCIDALINSGKKDLRIDQANHPFFQAKEELKKMNRNDLWTKLVMNFITLNPSFSQIQGIINEAPEEIQLKLYEDAAFLMSQLKHQEKDIEACCQALIIRILKKNQFLHIEERSTTLIAEAKRLTNYISPGSDDHYNVLKTEKKRLKRMQKICQSKTLLSHKINNIEDYIRALEKYLKLPKNHQERKLPTTPYNQYGIDHQFTDLLLKEAEELTDKIEDSTIQINHYIDIYFNYNWDCETKENLIQKKIKTFFDLNLGSQYKIEKYLSFISSDKLDLIERLALFLPTLGPIFYWEFSGALDRLIKISKDKFSKPSLNEKLVRILCQLQKITHADYSKSRKVVTLFLNFFKTEQTSPETMCNLISTIVESFESSSPKWVAQYRIELTELKKKIKISPIQQPKKAVNMKNHAMLLQGVAVATLWGLTHLYRALR